MKREDRCCTARPQLHTLGWMYFRHRMERNSKEIDVEDGRSRMRVAVVRGWILEILAGVLVHRATRDRCVAVFRVVVAGRYLVCRFN